MAVFFLGLVLFLLGFVTHVVLWRIRRPRATARGLIILFVATILSSALLLAFAGQINPTGLSWLPPTLDEWMQSLTMAFALAAAYVVSYPAIEVASPTLVIIDVVDSKCHCTFECANQASIAYSPTSFFRTLAALAHG